MDQFNNYQSEKSLLPWKAYVALTLESLIAFYLASFCMAMYFTHRGSHWVAQGLLLTILYLFVIFVCAKRIITQLPMAALMLVIPIAPFLALAVIVSLIPLLEIFS